jgi:solute carrier family 25 phosphate transporter 23/24/25/41
VFVLLALAKMWREEGPLSYWKGNGTNVARIAPYSAIQFFSFDVYKRVCFCWGGKSTFLYPLNSLSLLSLLSLSLSFAIRL